MLFLRWHWKPLQCRDWNCSHWYFLFYIRTKDKCIFMSHLFWFTLLLLYKLLLEYSIMVNKKDHFHKFKVGFLIAFFYKVAIWNKISNWDQLSIKTKIPKILGASSVKKGSRVTEPRPALSWRWLTVQSSPFPFSIC